MDLKKYIDENGNCVIPYGITEIKKEEFYDCSKLINISIPDSVERIERDAFKSCISLTNISIPESVKVIGSWAFYNCVSLTNVSVPKSVEYIGCEAFSKCTSLVNFSAQNSEVCLGGDTFNGCTSLTNVTIPNTVKKIACDEGLPNMTSFFGCTSLTNISIPDSVEEIGKYAFKNCTSLTNISIPRSVREIGREAFAGCTSLTSVSIQSNHVRVRPEAFKGCTSLTDVSFFQFNGWAPDIETEAFLGCNSLKRFYCSEDCSKELKENSRYYLGEKGIHPIGVLKSVLKKAIIKEIYSDERKKIYKDGRCVFFKNVDDEELNKRTDIKNIEILQGVNKIGKNAFKGCTKLTEVIIPDSVSIVGEDAFSGCKNVERLQCPRSLVGKGFVENGKEMIMIGESVVPKKAVVLLGDTEVSDTSSADSHVDLKEAYAIPVSECPPVKNANDNGDETAEDTDVNNKPIGEHVSFNELNLFSASKAPVARVESSVKLDEKDAQMD